MFKVLHSSAGAGKTHALVKHYLQLALADNDEAAYARILALTFTNKAAGEMRERILLYLEGLSKGGDLSLALSDVQETLMRECDLTSATIKERTQRTLTHMLHHWPQLAVSTIDAFTRRVVMPFARDLRLDSELRMTTEEQDFRDMAVDRLLEEAGSDIPLTELLVSICEDLIEQERDWRIDKPLRALTTQLTREQAITHLEQLRSLGHAQFIDIQRRLRADTSAFRERIRLLGRNALEALSSAGIRDEDMYYGKNGPIGYLRALAVFEDWMDEKKNTLKALEQDKWAADKASAYAREAIDRVAPLLREAIGTVEDLRGTGELQHHALACAVLRNLLPAAALHLLDQRLESVKQEEGVAFFSDLVKKVAAIVQEEPAPFLYERLGEKYRHFLVDEFQDTSMLQWHSLLPLITNALSTGGSALLVGDAKQAIYRWRNGEARQFVRLPGLFGRERVAAGDEHEAILERSHKVVEPLAQNHRSARAIIRFNNDLFDALHGTLPEEHRPVYDGHAQREVKEHDGYVHIACLAKPEAGDEEVDEEDVPPPAASRFTAEAVQEAIADGFAPGDVAVLVRTKAQGRAIATHLVEQGHQVVSPDGLSLGSDPAVRAVMAVLTWIHRPDDAHAALAIQRIVMIHGTAPTDPFHGNHPTHLMRRWMADRPAVHPRRPLLSLLHAITDALAIDPARDAFVLGLFNEAHVFTQEHGDAPIAFLDHWERVAGKRSVGGTDDRGAIRVMTVHGSKGLQFPVVIVPFADMAVNGPRDAVWIDPRGVAADLPAALVRPGKTLDHLAIPEVMEEEKLVQLDVMDLLYVAFTRPEQRLYAAFAAGRKNGPGAAVRVHLGLEPGSIREFGERGPAAPHKEKKEAHAFTLAPSTLGERAPMAIRYEAPEEWDPSDPDPFRTHGRALHALLARVSVPQDLERAIAIEADAWGMDPGEREVVRERLEKLLQEDALGPFYGEGLEVRTEATLIDAEGRALRPDRIIRDGASTRVLDIKTGARSDRHDEQVLTYARLLRDLGEKNVTAHLLYVAEGTVVNVNGHHDIPG